ncbi:uncharacterized protein O3C94_016094 [Discoglossus pictus]
MHQPPVNKSLKMSFNSLLLLGCPGPGRYISPELPGVSVLWNYLRVTTVPGVVYSSAMAMEKTLCKAGMLVLAVCMMMYLQPSGGICKVLGCPGPGRYISPELPGVSVLWNYLRVTTVPGVVYSSAMAMEKTLCKAGMLVLAVCMMMNLQPTEAQNTTTNNTVPGWGIALLVLTALILAFLLCSLCLLPCLCRSGSDSCQSGFSIGK